jgi:hypothetical protein
MLEEVHLLSDVGGQVLASAWRLGSALCVLPGTILPAVQPQTIDPQLQCNTAQMVFRPQ